MLGSSNRSRLAALATVALLAGALLGLAPGDAPGARDRGRARRDVVGRRRQRIAPHAARPRERAVRDRPPRQHRRQPGAAAAPLDEGPLRLVRGAVPPGRPRRDDPAASRTSAPLQSGRQGTTLRDAALHAVGELLPAVGQDAGPAALHAAAVQHLDRAHLRPEPAGRARLRARDRRERLPARGADDRRGLGRGLRRLGLPPRPLPGPEGDDGRAARAGLQGDALGVPVHPARRQAVHGAAPRPQPRRLAAQREGPGAAGDHALVGRLQRRHRPHEPAGPRVVHRPAAAPRARRTASTASSSTAATPSSSRSPRC